MSADKSHHATQLNAFEKWKHSYSGRVAWTVLAATVCYIFASMAIDTGIFWQWGLAALFAIDSFYNIAQLVRKIANRHTNAKAHVSTQNKESDET